MRICIRNFDEQMCLKLSTHKFTEYKSYIEMSFFKEKQLVSHLDHYENKALERENAAQEFIEQISEFRTNVRKEFYETCQKVV